MHTGHLFSSDPSVMHPLPHIAHKGKIKIYDIPEEYHTGRRAAYFYVVLRHTDFADRGHPKRSLCVSGPFCTIKTRRKGHAMNHSIVKIEPGCVYNKLTVLEKVGSTKKGKSLWRCRCDCGNITIVQGDNLKSGHTTSCGCTKKIACRTISAKNRAAKSSGTYKAHDLSKTPLYHLWDTMTQRCENPNAQHFERYGRRGITVCDEWRNDFKAFYDWSMEHGWKKGLSIDRIDNNGPYAPWNCRWVDRKTQANNKSTNIILTYEGKSMTLKQWSEDLGWSYSCLHHRYTRGWTADKILSTPPKNI